MNESLKELAVRYFEGPISPDEERELFAFIAAAPENAARMREWEEEWKREHIPSLSVLDSLGLLKAKIRKRDGAMLNRRRWLRFTAAAAVLILISAFTTRYIMRLETPEQLFSVQAPQGTNSRISLPDGTQVWLNARTRLILPKAFSPTERNVKLAGAAFFEVARDEAAPFTVATDDLRVRVLGTAFCVQAYENSGQAEVVLEHGSVRLQTPEGVNLVTLQPDQRALYDAAADNLEISHVNASHLVLSQYDLVTMANATLHEIISHIETTYGVRISVPGRYGDKRYAFNYQRSNSLEEVLNIVEYMTGEHCEVIFRQK